MRQATREEKPMFKSWLSKFAEAKEAGMSDSDAREEADRTVAIEKKATETKKAPPLTPRERTRAKEILDMMREEE